MKHLFACAGPHRPREQERSAPGHDWGQDSQHRRPLQGLRLDPPQHGHHAGRRDVRCGGGVRRLAGNGQAGIHGQLQPGEFDWPFL